MTDPQLTLRLVRLSDAAATLDAFGSDPSMSRQGTVTSLAEAEAYLSGLIDDERQHPFAICDGDRLVGLVCVTLDAVNRVGWFWYWTNASHRGRGWAPTCATAVATIFEEFGIARASEIISG